MEANVNAAIKYNKKYRRLDELKAGDYFYVYHAKYDFIESTRISSIEEQTWKPNDGNTIQGRMYLNYVWYNSVLCVSVKKFIDGGYGCFDDYHSGHNNCECRRIYADINALCEDNGLDIRDYEGKYEI